MSEMFLKIVGSLSLKFVHSFFIVSLFIVNFGYANRCEQIGKCPEFDKFLKIFSAENGSNDIIARSIQNCQKDDDCRLELFANLFSANIQGMPGVYLKGTDLERIVNAAGMKRCIDLKNLTLLGVARKYVDKVGDNWMVFAEKISSPEGTHITLDLVKQLITLAEETGFRDWNENWFWDGKKLVCIDTDSASFFVGMVRGAKGRNDIPDHCKFNYVVSLMVWANRV